MPQNLAGTPNRGNLLLTPAQIANLPPQQQSAYMKGLTPAEQQLVQQEVAQQKTQANRRFLKQGIERYAYCPASGGSGNTQTYASGSTLVFDFPVVGGGYAKGLLVRATVNYTPVAGTGAAYLASVAAPWNFFSELQVVYNGAQIRMHPYILKVLDQTKGYAKYPALNGVPQGFQQTAALNTIAGVTPVTGAPGIDYAPPVTVAAQSFQFAFFLPFNAIADDTVPGLLPVMGVGNKPQLKLICAPSIMCNDPLLCPFAASAGTGGAISVQNTSTVSVDMVYQDGTTMSDPNGVALDLTTEPTLQYYWDTPLNPLNAGLLQRQHISTLLEHWYVISVLIDSQQLAKFATVGNITSFQLSADSVGQLNFYSFNIANNIPTYDYYDRLIRRVHGQDLDEGVFLWVDAPCRGVRDADNRDGVQVLNMQPGGYPAATHAYQVTAVSGETVFDGGAKAVPRVETFTISMNYNGLRLV